MRKRFGAVAVALVLCALTTGVSRAAPTLDTCEMADASNTDASPITLTSPTACIGQLTDAADTADWFQVAVAHSQRLHIQVSPIAPLFSSSITLRDPNGVPATDACTQTDAIDSCDVVANTAGLWRFGIGRDAGAGMYRLSLEIPLPQQADCGGADDAPSGEPLDVTAGAPLRAMRLLLTADTNGKRAISCQAAFDADDAMDAYAFDVNAGTRIQVNVKDLGQVQNGTLKPNVDGLTLVDPSGSPQATDTSHGQIDFVAVTGGTWVLKVARPAQSAGGPYSMDITTQQQDCATSGDAGDTAAGSIVMTGTSVVTCAGGLDGLAKSGTDSSSFDGTDWYTFVSKPNTSVNVGFNGSTATCQKISVWAELTATATPADPPAFARTICDGVDPAVYSKHTSPSTTKQTWYVRATTARPPVALDGYALDYGTVSRGQDSATQRITLTATRATSIRAITFGGADKFDFSIANSTCAPGAALALKQTCSLDVMFHPLAEGARTAFVNVIAGPADGSDDVRRLVSLSGAGGPGALDIQPGSTRFPAVVYGGTSSGTNDIAVQVIGDQPVTFAQAYIAGANPGDFKIASDTCSWSTVGPGRSCTVKLSFAPTDNGARSAQLLLPNNATDAPRAVAIAGTGLAPVLASSAQSLAFGTVTSGLKKTLNVSLTNTGGAQLKGMALTLEGTNASQFSVSKDACSTATLQPGDSCAVTVQFAPTGSAGDRAAALRVTAAAPNSPILLALGGTARSAAPLLNITPQLIDFGKVILHTTAAPRTIAISNLGGGSLTVQSVAITGGQLDAFKVTGDPCTGKSLNGGDICTLTTAFTPSVIDLQAVTLSIVTSLSPNAVQLTLAGTGVETGAILTTDRGLLAFGPKVVGSKNLSTVTLTNTGNARVTNLEIGLDASRDYSIYDNSCTWYLDANASCAIDVQFSPVMEGMRATTLQISGDSLNRSVTIPISGTGTAPKAMLATATPDAAQIGDARSFNVTVTNTGTAPLSIASITTQNPDANAPDFILSSDACTEAARPSDAMTLAPGASCIARYTFEPRAAGARAGTVSISTNAGDQTISVNGVGLPIATPLFDNGGWYSLTVAGVSVDAPPPASDCGITGVTDASNTPAGANTIADQPGDVSCAGMLTGTNDSDYFAIRNVTPTTIVHVTPRGDLPAGTLICQFDSAGRPVGAVYEAGALVGCDSVHRVSAAEMAGGTWTIGVIGGSGAYAFDVHTLAQNDCGTGGDASQTIAEAQQRASADATSVLDATLTPVLCVGQGPLPSEGDLSDAADGVDVYAVKTGVSTIGHGALVVTASPKLGTAPDLAAGSDLDVTITAPDGTVTRGVSTGNGLSEVAAATCGSATACGNGVWYVEIRLARGALGAYDMTITGRTP